MDYGTPEKTSAILSVMLLYKPSERVSSQEVLDSDCMKNWAKPALVEALGKNSVKAVSSSILRRFIVKDSLFVPYHRLRDILVRSHFHLKSLSFSQTWRMTKAQYIAGISLISFFF